MKAILELILLGTAVWVLICNNRTYKDRCDLLDKIAAHDSNFFPLLRDYMPVSYAQHLLARFLLRDPMKLYPPVAWQCPAAPTAAAMLDAHK